VHGRFPGRSTSSYVYVVVRHSSTFLVGLPGQVDVEGVPQTLMEGELVHATLVMQNPSPVALQGLRCVVSSEDIHVAPTCSQPGGLSGVLYRL
jgi:hypothetical protein